MLAPPQQAIETESSIKTNTRPTTQNNALPISTEPKTEGLISIASTSSTSSTESFDLLRDLNNAKDEDQKAQQEGLKSPKPDPIEPMQTMGQPNSNLGYDPNRIPSSIFASKPTSPMDWSVTSNESLFSIHMGNNSFSKDHAILMGGRSGELYNFDDLIYNVPGQLPKPSEINNLQNLPTVVEGHSDAENFGKSVNVYADITPTASMKLNLEDKNKETNFHQNFSNISDGRETPTRVRNHRLSDESGTTSSSSFAFPLITGDGSYHKVKVGNENILPRPVEKPQREAEAKQEREREPDPKLHSPSPKAAAGMKWFSWLSWFRIRPFSPCFPRRCSICC